MFTDGLVSSAQSRIKAKTTKKKGCNPTSDRLIAKKKEREREKEKKKEKQRKKKTNRKKKKEKEKLKIL